MGNQSIKGWKVKGSNHEEPVGSNSYDNDIDVVESNELLFIKMPSCNLRNR
jgi:hypothetical protein